MVCSWNVESLNLDILAYYIRSTFLVWSEKMSDANQVWSYCWLTRGFCCSYCKFICFQLWHKRYVIWCGRCSCCERSYINKFLTHICGRSSFCVWPIIWLLIFLGRNMFFIFTVMEKLLCRITIYGWYIEW